MTMPGTGSKCIELKTKKYQSRNSPPYPANDCIGEVKKGNDGKNWKSVPNKNMIYKWMPAEKKDSRNMTKKQTDKQPDKQPLTGSKIYYIHDNHGRPFKVIVDGGNKNIKVYKDIRNLRAKDIPEEPIYDKLVLQTKYKTLFNGSPLPKGEDKVAFEPGNSILIYVNGNKYIYIGHEIYSFETASGKDNEIIKYISPIGNNDVPYPYAISEKNTYLMIEDVILDNQYLNDSRISSDNQYKNDPYCLYYGWCGENNLKEKAIKLKKKIIHKRL